MCSRPLLGGTVRSRTAKSFVQESPESWKPVGWRLGHLDFWLFSEAICLLWELIWLPWRAIWLL